VYYKNPLVLVAKLSVWLDLNYCSFSSYLIFKKINSLQLSYSSLVSEELQNLYSSITVYCDNLLETIPSLGNLPQLQCCRPC
jgi:hypothetical protein